MKFRFSKIFSFIVFLLLFINITTIKVNAEDKIPTLNAKAAILMDADTGNVLYSKNGYKEYFPASTTKVLTALIVLENSNLNDVVTIGEKPPFADGSSIGLKEGEKFTVETLLTGLLLESGNDCAQALAEHIAGSEENFVVMMNEKAKSIGATHSNFENASGLPNENHKATAYDLALILKEAIKNPDFVRISQLTSVELPPSNLDNAKRWANNHNHLVNPNSKYYYKYALAGKSGYTNVAKHTFVISAKKDGRTLVAAFLMAENKDQNFKDMVKLLDYGFDNFTNIEIFKKNQVIETKEISKKESLPLLAENDVLVSIPKSIKDTYMHELKYNFPNNYDELSYKKGEKITTASLFIDGKELKTFNLISGKSIEKNSFYKFKKIFKLIFIIVILILAIIISVRKLIINRKKKKAFKRKWKHVINRHNKY